MCCSWLRALAVGMTNPLVTYLELETVSPGLLHWLREWHAPPDFDKTVPNSLFNTALIASTILGHSDVVHLLLQKGAVNVNAKYDEMGYTALHIAAVLDRVAIAELLTRFGADVNAKEESLGLTALHIAALEGHLAIAELLERAGADLHAKTAEAECTPLHLATVRGNVAMARSLTGLGADVNANDKDGNTPFHIATLAQQMDMVEWFGSNGADLNAKNAEGQTPIAIAVDSDRMDMVKSIWNAAYSKLEDLGKDANNPILSLLKEAFAGGGPHLGATVLKYIAPLNFEELKLPNEGRVAGIERKHINDQYEYLHKYVKMLEKAKEQQLQSSTKRKLLKPLHSAGFPGKRAKKPDRGRP